MEPDFMQLYFEEPLLYKKSYLYEIFKRVTDIIGAILALILFSPILIVTSIAIKIDTKGPILFSQNRCGKNGTVFKMYKFRSMCTDAEKKLDKLKEKNSMNGPVFKIKNDPRITRVGNFIRKRSIDELPQFFNVLKGDMSLVGPRPPICSEVLCYNTYELKRLIIKPGITCYWQTMGRNCLSFDKWVELDIKYIADRNLWIDLKLIFKTFFVLFGDENAW